MQPALSFLEGALAQSGGETMKSNTRIGRVNDAIFKEMSQIIRAELKDPRISAMTSVIRVETTPDLKYCKVYVSVFGGDEEKASVMKGLKNANGFIRRQIAQRVNLRITPELIFKLDESAEYAVHMDQLMAQITKERLEREGGSEEALDEEEDGEADERE